MMGLGKPQRLAKFEVAGFIYYVNIREFVFKNSDKPKWGNPLFGGKLNLPLDSQTQCVTFIELRLHQVGDLYEKTAFYNGKFLILGTCKVGVENFCIKLQKGTPLRQIWSNKSFGVCGSDVVLTLEGDEKKKVRENRH